jgi:hypothetical protein
MGDLSYLYEDGFDTEEAAEQTGADFKPVPKGTYRVKVSSADLGKTKAGNADVLKLRLDIVGPQHAGRVIFDDIIIKHPSEDAQRIGKTKFAGLARAVGAHNPKTTDVLVAKEVEAFIKVESQIGYDDRNKVAFYSPASAGGFTVAGASAGFNNDDVPF